ncbi:PatB family C-S lyase [bacterium]|nr:PatB family C-S lyase [bacterium]
MSFDFDTPVDRTGTNSEKWDRYAGRDILPLWVADADFRSPAAVVDALAERARHGVYGYPGTPPGLVEVFLETCEREWGWRVDPAWLVWLPGLVCGLSVTCRAVGEPGSGVAVHTPVYGPFLRVPGLMDRTVRKIALEGDNAAGWTCGREHFAAGLTDDVRLFLLCHPHNPVGRMWRRDELAVFAEECLRRDVVICSDEIHAQLSLATDRRHVPLASLSPEIAARTITLLAPSKAFNIAGLGCSVAVIPDDSLRRRFERAKAGIVPHVNVFGLVAAEAAWRHGGDWLAAQLVYLRANRDLLAAAVADLPGVSMSRVEATYLAWLDVRELGLTDAGAHFESHGLGFSPGEHFDGPGYVRCNFACPRATLEKAIRRLRGAVEAARG